jgi:hypothetical protein
MLLKRIRIYHILADLSMFLCNQKALQTSYDLIGRFSNFILYNYTGIINRLTDLKLPGRPQDNQVEIILEIINNIALL